MTFLPDGHKEPVQASNYMKLIEGDNTFRVLSSAITGWEIWGTETKEGKEVRMPYRFKDEDSITPKYQALETETNRFKYFWAFVVYNRQDLKVQILELTQATIRKAILALVNNPKWGDPKEYDIVITKNKTGSEMRDVEYIVTPDPKEIVDPEITKKYKSMNINLEALYSNDDPFKSEEVNVDEIPDFDKGGE